MPIYLVECPNCGNENSIIKDLKHGDTFDKTCDYCNYLIKIEVYSTLKLISYCNAEE